MDRFKDKVVWITGASSGIGEELALQLSLLGAKLILSARSVDKLQAVQKRCTTPTGVAVLPLDLMEFENADQNVEKALSFFGKVDVLINNAGISQRSLIIDTHFSVYQKIMDIDYLGTVALSTALLPAFVQQKSGHFVTVSSVMGKFSSPYRAGYCGAKHALHGFFDALRMEHEQDGVMVTMVCPGFVRTPIAKNALIADGSAQGVTDNATEKGMELPQFCQKMIRAMAKKKFEVYIGGKEVKGVFLKRFFPKILHRKVLKSKVR